MPIYRGREQHGEGREAGVKGTGSGRAVYGRREVLTPLSPPHFFDLKETAVELCIACCSLVLAYHEARKRNGKMDEKVLSYTTSNGI